MNTQTQTNGAQDLRRPTKQRAISGRGILGLALTIALPPLGLLFLWHQGVFRTRGRMLLTALATAEMVVIGVLLTPHAELTTMPPLPVAPVAVTAAPESENLNALYNIEQLLYEQQLAKVVAEGGTERDLMTEEEKIQAQQADREAILNTIVYAVYNNAQRYHATMICGTQSNGRALTVQEAMLEALSPCPDCNPPVWTD